MSVVLLHNLCAVGKGVFSPTEFPYCYRMLYESYRKHKSNSARSPITPLFTFVSCFRFHFILNRIALATDHGTRAGIVDDIHVGMWAVSKVIWEKQSQLVFRNWTESYRRKILDDIWVNFCIDWNEATFDDVNIPMYGALTIAILLEVIFARNWYSSV